MGTFSRYFSISRRTPMRRRSAASLLASDWCSPLSSFWADVMCRRKNLCVASASSRLTGPLSIMIALQRNVPRAWDKHSRRFKISVWIFCLMDATLSGKIAGLPAVLYVSSPLGATDVATTASSCSRCKISTCKSRISAFANDTTLLITGVDGRSTVEYTGSLSTANGAGRVAGRAAADCGLKDAVAAVTLVLRCCDSVWDLSRRRRDVRLLLDDSVDAASIDSERPRRGRRRLGVSGIRSTFWPSVAARGRKTTVRLCPRGDCCCCPAVGGVFWPLRLFGIKRRATRLRRSMSSMPLLLKLSNSRKRTARCMETKRSSPGSWLFLACRGVFGAFQSPFWVALQHGHSIAFLALNEFPMQSK